MLKVRWHLQLMLQLLLWLLLWLLLRLPLMLVLVLGWSDTVGSEAARRLRVHLYFHGRLHCLPLG